MFAISKAIAKRNADPPRIAIMASFCSPYSNVTRIDFYNVYGLINQFVREELPTLVGVKLRSNLAEPARVLRVLLVDLLCLPDSQRGIPVYQGIGEAARSNCVATIVRDPLVAPDPLIAIWLLP